MAEVTVIAPNVVEFAGNVARQATPIAAPALPQRPPPTGPETPLKARDEVGARRRQPAANQNSAPATPSASKSIPPGGFNPADDPRRQLGQPSTQFIAQQIAQESTSTVQVTKPSRALLAAYEKSRPRRSQADAEPVIITRSVNLTV